MKWKSVTNPVIKRENNFDYIPTWQVLEKVSTYKMKLKKDELIRIQEASLICCVSTLVYIKFDHQVLSTEWMKEN